MSESIHEPTLAVPASAARERTLAVLFAAVLGIVLVFGAGFAPSSAVHNAAHDSSHSFAFPCH